MLSKHGLAGLVKVPGPGGGVSLIASSSDSDSGSATTYTSPALSIGTASANRRCYAMLAYGFNAVDPTSVTIGGVTASQIGSSLVWGASSNTHISVYAADVPTGTTAVVVSTWVSSQGGYAVSLHSVDDTPTTESISASQQATSATTVSVNSNVSNGDILIGMGASANSGTISWSGLTSSENGDFNTGELWRSATLEATGAETPRTISFDDTISTDIAAVVLRLEP